MYRKKIVIINCSPRKRNSSSHDYGEYLINSLEEKGREWDYRLCYEKNSEKEIIDASVSSIVFIYPLYVDALPSGMVQCLEKLEKEIAERNLKGIDVYAIVNCGFPEAIHNKISLEMLEIFCEKTGLNWRFGVSIGGGQFLREISRRSLKLKKIFNRRLDTIIEDILEKKSEKPGNRYHNLPLPKWLFVRIAHAHWEREGAERIKWDSNRRK